MLPDSETGAVKRCSKVVRIGAAPIKCQNRQRSASGIERFALATTACSSNSASNARQDCSVGASRAVARVSCTRWSAASTPEQPPARGGGLSVRERLETLQASIAADAASAGRIKEPFNDEELDKMVAFLDPSGDGIIEYPELLDGGIDTLQVLIDTLAVDDLETRFNAAFTCPMRKIRIPMANLDESHNPKRVEEDRTVATEGAIVRIMKARKTLSHQQLLAEVLSQLAFFRPNPKVIKRRIEALIDREYLERDPDQPNTYRYLA